jgi:hypothetical protein
MMVTVIVTEMMMEEASAPLIIKGRITRDFLREDLCPK